MAGHRRYRLATGLSGLRTLARWPTDRAVGRWLAWGLLAVGLSISFAAFAATYRREERDGRARFEARVLETERAIRERLATYEQALRGLSGLFRASDEVTRRDFQLYLAQLDIQRRYPGIQGFGYQPIVREADRRVFTERVRAEGFPDFEIYPPEPRDEYAPVLYTEPFGRNSAALGFDLYTEPVRRAALLRARDTGLTRITSKIHLMIGPPGAGKPAFLMCPPLYHRDTATDSLESRQSAHEGYVVAVFLMERLMKQVLGPEEHDVHLHVFDGPVAARGKLMYDGAPASEVHHDWNHQSFARAERVFEIHGHQWLLRFNSLPAFDATVDTQEAWTILGMGITIALLLFGVVWTLTTTQARAVALAQEMTVRIRRNEALLERKNRELEEFLYAASHDLKSPVVTVMGYSAHMERDAAEGKLDELPEFARRISAAAGRMRAHIDDLLELSRIGRVSDKIERVDLSELATEIGKSLVPQLMRARAVYTVQPDMPVVWASRARLWQLVENLLTNAIKFSARSDPPTIEVGTAWEDGVPWLYVQDNGCGIDPAYHERIFGMFQRLGRDTDGSGVGLAIVKRIAELYGGHVRVESAVGRGARFLVSFDPTLCVASRSAA